jgi:enediyne biosynthesis protein E4
MRRLIALALALAGEADRLPNYENVAAKAGLVHSFPNGGTQSKKYIIETTGSGVAMLDYDNDGFVDLFFVSGEGGTNRLYRNDTKGRFIDVTAATGLTRNGWGQGVCAGDYDSDGFIDLFVTYWGQNALYHNEGGRKFADLTAKSKLVQDRVRYNTGCAFIDYDNDGDPDLFVANYLRFDFATTPKPGENPYCWYRGLPVNCGPRGLPFESNLLYRNNGDGTFTDVSAESGIGEPRQSYCLGAVTGDFDQNGWTDLYVACDQTPSLLYMNQGGGKFKEEALLRGAALDENGKALSGMGAAAGDYDGDGLVDLFRTNFSDERETLYRNRGSAEFDEATTSAGLAHNTRFVGWGCGFFDFDNDGWRDLLLVNGHAFPEVDKLNIDIRYRDRAILYRNLGRGKFEDISERAGAGIAERHSSRGLATGDVDNDGSLEVAVNHQNEAPSLLRNRAKHSGNWVILKLEGTRSNRSAIGARVRVTAGGRTQVDEVRGGGSYLSQHDLRLHFGLGSAREIERVEIDWPSGAHQIVSDIRLNRVTPIKEK